MPAIKGLSASARENDLFAFPLQLVSVLSALFLTGKSTGS